MFYDFLAFFSFYFAAGMAVIILFARINRSTRTEVRVFTLGLLFKLACTYFYYIFTLSNSADALGYFYYAQSVGFVPSIKALFQISTAFVDNVAAFFYPLVLFFDNQYLMLYIPFSIIGFIGSLLFYKTLSAIAPVKNKKELYIISFFLPNMVFWTTNLGKDSLMYLGVASIMYGALGKIRFPKNGLYIVGGGLLVFMIRPHMFLFMTCGFLLGLLFEKRKLSFGTIAMFVLVFGGLMFSQKKIMNFVGIKEEQENASAVSYYNAGVSAIEHSSRELAHVGGGSTIESSHKFSILYLPYYLVMFLGSPFLWQAKKPIQFFSGIETVIYQIMIVYLCIHWKDVVQIRFIRFKYSWLMYLILTAIIEGAAQTNFGLIIRQRCMILPVVFLFFIGLRYYLLVNKSQKPTKRGHSISLPNLPLYGAKTKA